MKKKPNPSDPSEKELLEFRDLINALRNALPKAKLGDRPNVPELEAARVFARERGWEWGVTFAEGCLSSWTDPAAAITHLQALEVPDLFKGKLAHLRGLACAHKGDYDEAIRWYKAALETEGYDCPGDARDILGNLYFEKREYDEAIKWYGEALDTPGCATPGNVRNNLGLAHNSKGDYDEAIRWYREALETEGFDNPGTARNNLGTVYASKGDYDEAIRWYRAALDTEGYDTPGNSRNNLGVTYYEKGDYDEAIRWHQAALETDGYETPALTRNNLANAYRRAGKLTEAKEAVSHVLDEPDTEGQHDRARYILGLIEQQEAGTAPTASDNDLANPDEDAETEALREKLRRTKNAYVKYIADAKDKKRPVPPDQLTILRGWCSSTPLLDGAQNSKIRGGGYFLKWEGKGLVIDPGFDFVDNFHDYGLFSLDIDVVAVSHDHGDHNADLWRLDDLLYEVYDRQDGKSKKPTHFALDSATTKRIDFNGKSHLQKYELHLKKQRNEEWFGKAEKLPFRIEHFGVDHTADVPDALGFIVRLLRDDGAIELSIGYTGDTQFSDRLVKELSGVDVLIAHVSQPSAEELTDETYLKRGHLGINGLRRMITEMDPKPELVLVGEFWSGIDDLRMDIIKWLRKRTGRMEIFPATLGLSLSLPDLKIRCENCKTMTPHSRVRIVPKGQYSDIQYNCDKCIT